ncbi:MAG: efflux RND transporter periplasmic adaptor subunit [Chloroflexota bacterium]
MRTTSVRQALALPLLAGLALAGCGLGASKAAKPTYQTVQVRRGTIINTVSASGSIELSQVANISPAAGSTSTATKLKSLAVKVGQVVAAGQAVAQLDTSGLENSLAQAKINLRIAQAKYDATVHPNLSSLRNQANQDRLNVASAQAKLQALIHPDTTSLANQLLADKINLATAQTKLNATEHPYTAADIAGAQMAVTSDRLSLTSAQQALAAIKVSPEATANISAQQNQVIYWTNNYIRSKQAYDKGQETKDKLNADYQGMSDAKAQLQALKDKAASDITAAQQAVNQAQGQLQKDQATLSLEQGGAKPTDLQLARQQVQLAQQAYAAARKELAQPTAPSDIQQAQISAAQAQQAYAAAVQSVNGDVQPSDVAQAQGSVDLSKEAVTLAQQQLAAATLRAPFAGTVTAVGASPGDSVTASTDVVTVSNLAKAQVDANINQLDVGKLRVGQAADVKVEAIPSRAFSGKVVSIASTATNSQGVITYAVTVALDSTGNVLRPGMTATVRMVVKKASNVLELPSAAVQSGSGGSFVELPPNLRHQAIHTGISSGTKTEITSGLTDGEQVAIPSVPRAAPSGAGKASAAGSSKSGTTPGLGNVPGVGGPPPPGK